MADNRTEQMQALKLYKLKEVEELTGFSRPTLFRYIKDGKLIAKKIGQGWKVSEADLKAFLEGN